MDDTQRRILLCARDLYLRHGIETFSMRQVARFAGISAAAIYRHYENKQELLQAILIEGFALFDRYLRHSLAADTAAARLEASGAAYLDFALDNPRDYNLIFQAEQPWPAKERPEPVARLGDRTFQFLVQRVRECQADETLIIDDTESAARFIWSHSHGLVSLYLSGHFAVDEATFRDYWRTASRYLLAGLGANAGRITASSP